MCSKSSHSRRRKKAVKEEATVVIPSRKTRSKTRKPKYLSLKLELSPRTKNPQRSKTKMIQNKQLINLFPLHPENHVQQYKDMHDPDQVAFLLETASDDISTTLQGLLDTTTTTATTSDDGPLSCYIEIDRERCDGRASLLEKTAMKCKERDLSDERWVSYWEVVEKKELEEVSSSSCYGVSDTSGKIPQAQDDNKKGLVGLKLDYQEILNAWSDKGSLFIEGESPQTVPDIHDGSSELAEEWGNLWRVPDMCGTTMKEGKEIWKSGQREASVLRYKEKRQNRLFAKRIRYEVRKLNAEKRPRLKGRFVKRS
uniref:CCT domain-containing protein n=1 Tax=Salix viminalis TaxID=40686 RepID=A0A6N2KCC0_SALVM